MGIGLLRTPAAGDCGGRNDAQSAADSDAVGEVGESETLVSLSRSSSALEIDSASAAQFPADLLEAILSKLPFPEIFIVKMLSKAWYSKLPSLNPVKSLTTPVLEDQEAFILPQVDVSFNWSTLCPVFLSGQEMVGYESTHRRWRKIPVHHSLKPVLGEVFTVVSRVHLMVAIAGPLVCVYSLNLAESDVLITNPLLGTWRRLSGFRTVHESSCVCRVGAGGYSVVVHAPWQHSDGYVRFRTRVLDSRTKTWRRGESIQRSQVNEGVVDYGRNVTFSACLDGKTTYSTLTSDWSKKVELWQYQIESGVWTNMQLARSFEDFEFHMCGLFAVASQILLVIMVDKTYTSPNSPIYSECALVYSLDMATFQLCEPWRSPPMRTQLRSIGNPSRVTSDSEYLYFVREMRRPGDDFLSLEMWSFHVPTVTWSSVPAPPVDFARTCNLWNLAEGVFAPGLNPSAVP